MLLGDHAQAPSCRAQLTALRAGAAVALGLICLSPLPAQALDLTFGAALRLDGDDNPDLDDSTSDGLTQAQLRFNLDGLWDTGSAQLAFGFAGQFQGDISGPGSGRNTRFSSPSAYVSYSQAAANSSFTMGLALLETDLTRNQAIDDFDENVGHRRTVTANAGFTVGDSSSLGFAANLFHDDVTYSDDPSGTQVDYRRTRLNTQTRMDITEVMQATLGLGFGHYEADDGTDRDSVTADFGLNIARPFGVASATLQYAETDGKDRVSLRVGHTFEMPRGTQSISIGMARGPGGEFYGVGSLGLSLATPNGGWSATLDRGLSTGQTTDTEVIFTQLSVSYAHALSPVDGLSFDVGYAERETLSNGATVTRADIGASYNRALSDEWSVNVGIRHRARWQSAGSDDSGNSAFVELRHTLQRQY